MCIYQTFTEPACIPITITAIWYFRNLCLPSVWSSATPLNLNEEALSLTCWRKRVIAWENSYWSLYKHWIRTCLSFLKNSLICAALPKKRDVYKKSPNKIVVLSLLKRCERPQCRKMVFVMQEYKFLPMAHHSYMPTVSMREMSDRKRNCQGHVKLPYICFNQCQI